MKRARNLADLLAFVVLGILLASFVSLKIARTRAASRRVDCADNLKQLGLAIHNYHSAYRQLPTGSGGTDQGGHDNPLKGNSGRLSAFVPLTPFYEAQALWEQIANPHRTYTTTFPPMGPVPWLDGEKYPPWSKRPTVLVCPDDTSAQNSLASSYVLNYGDGVYKVFYGKADWASGNSAEGQRIRMANQRGLFSRQHHYRFRDVLDGLSNTLMMSEMHVLGTPVAKGVVGLPWNPSLAIKAQGGKSFWPKGRQARWCDGLLRSTGFQTILPPGSPSATSDEGDQTAVMSASSSHGAGAHVVMGDGAVKFVTASIDAGDATSASVGYGLENGTDELAKPGSPSPYGLWGALGTRASMEVISDQLHEAESGVAKPRPSLSPDQLDTVKQGPLRTWTAAGGRGTIKGWLVSCSRDGAVVLLSEVGDIRHLTLSDLDSRDAYYIVELQSKQKLEAKKILLEQLREAVGLLERKKFAEFMKRFVDPTTMDLNEMTRMGTMIYQSRGLFIQAFDTAIQMTEKGEVQIEILGGKPTVQFGRRMRVMGIANFAMSFSDGRWRMVYGIR